MHAYNILAYAWMICLDYSQICPHTRWRISPHAVKPRASKAQFPPQSKTVSQGLFFVLLSPSAYCPHNQINTAANSSGRGTHPKNRRESCSDQKQTVWSYWIDQSADELIGNSLSSTKDRLWDASSEEIIEPCKWRLDILRFTTH